MTRKEKLIEEINRLDKLRNEAYKKIREIEDEERPKVGEVAMVWDDNEDDFIIGKVTDLTGIMDDVVVIGNLHSNRNAKRLTKQQVIDLLFGKEENNV